MLLRDDHHGRANQAIVQGEPFLHHVKHRAGGSAGDLLHGDGLVALRVKCFVERINLHQAELFGHGVEHFDLNKTDILMIENVGNLVCPASFDLGEDMKVVVLSTTEGEDKPAKYPQMFRAAQLMIINKTDLLPYLDFDIEKCREYALQVNPGLTIMELSCRSGEGLDSWYNWLKTTLCEKQQ